MTPTPLIPGERSLTYEVCTCSHIVFVIEKHAYIFVGGRGNFYWGDFHLENFLLGVKFPGVNFSGKILHWGNFLEIS